MHSPRPTSILLICHAYPPVLGGSEIEAQRVCKALVERGHDVTVLCAGHPEMPQQSWWRDPYGVRVRIIGCSAPRRFLDHVFALGVAWTLFWHFRKYKVVYFLMQGLHLAVGLPITRLLGKPVVMKISGSGIVPLMQRSFLGRKELEWLRRWAHRVMILNPGIAAEANAAGIPNEKLFWMPNPVDTNEFRPAENRQAIRAELNLPADAPVVLYVGRLAPEKELSSLIQSFPAVLARQPNALLVLVGAGPLADSLAAEAQALGIASSVLFPGRQPMDRVLLYLQASDVFALVSSLEGFPCSLLEAMAVGLSSVASDIPANRQLIDDGVHGLLAETRNPASIADALLRLLADPALRHRQGLAARERVENNYSTAHIVTLYEQLFAAAEDQA